MKITYANMLARLCDVYGADVDVITDALGLDSRIGPKYLKGALATVVRVFPGQYRAELRRPSVWHACDPGGKIDRFNREQVLPLASTVLERLPEGAASVSSGCPTSPTQCDRKSQGMAFAQYFLAKGVPGVYDPAALPTALPHLRDRSRSPSSRRRAPAKRTCS
jgi:UDPglucose 6-dehydrogenase